MRRLHDPLYRVLGPPRARVRPAEQRALALVEQRPGVTVGELRDALAVGSARIWQVVERLEWLGALHRSGARPRRLGPRRLYPRTIHEQLGPDVPTRLLHQHQALNTMLIFEHLANAPRSVSALAEITGNSRRTIRRLLARLEHDGYVMPTVGRDPGIRVYALASAAHELGRRLCAAVTRPRP
jgi:DNA-binding MarR family transcriptional regulator